MSTVGVGFVHHASAISPMFRRSLTAAMMRDAATKRRICSEYDQESSANIATARCTIVERFLADRNAPDWLFMVDTDMTFGDDLLERLISTAKAYDAPIVGGLCFGVRPRKVDGVEVFNATLGTELELFPTIYNLDAGVMSIVFDYPDDALVQVAATGAACLLIRRDVLADERWREDGHPQPWFRELGVNGQLVSEDQFFCLRANALGFPVHVDTGARTGHVKQFVADEDHYKRTRS